MDLLEHQGKALFRRHGIPVPDGALWPELPAEEGEMVVKAQVFEGRRGKRGGIRFVRSREDAQDAALEMAETRIGVNTVEAVYIEPRLDIARELYLAIALDRDRGCLVLMASPYGGVDVEDAPTGSLLRLPIDPLLGLRDFHVRAAGRGLGCTADQEEGIATVVRALYALVMAEDALLAEINPLIITGAGKIQAGDAKVTLDDNAAFRRTGAAGDRVFAAGNRTPLEAEIAETGAVGIEIDPDGDMVAVVSGAGLMMATLDILSEAGSRVRAVVDLGGSVLAGGETLSRVFNAVSGFRPRTTLVNAYLHTAFTDELARMLVEAQRIAPLTGRVVIRLKGRGGDIGRPILAQEGFQVFEELGPAIAAVTRRPETS